MRQRNRLFATNLITTNLITAALFTAALFTATLLTAALLLVGAASVAAADEPEVEAAGAPARIEVFPSAVRLTGPRRQMHLVVTGHYDDGTVRDLTRVASFTSSDPSVAEVDHAVVQPRGDGTAHIVVRAGDRETQVGVDVEGRQMNQPGASSIS